MTAKIIAFRKPRQKKWAELRAEEIDAQVRRHFAEAFRYDRNADALVIWLADHAHGSQIIPFHLETQERIYLET